MSELNQKDAADVPEVIRRLGDVLPARGRVLLIPHNYPDPDALASAAGMHLLLSRQFGVRGRILFTGTVSRAENREMLRQIRYSWGLLAQEDPPASQVPCILVDTSPWSTNVEIPSYANPIAVIDHHPCRQNLDDLPFVDVRDGYGATATITYEYAQVGGVPLSTNVLTALFYAIKSETQELGRGAGYADQEAYLSLLPRADKMAVSRIQQAPVPRKYFRAFQVGIENAHLQGRIVITDLKTVDNPDLVAEMADFLLRLEGADWAGCMGLYNRSLLLSLRTGVEDAHAGQIIRRVVAGLGRAGGHGAMAGGQIPLGERDYGEVADQIKARLVDELANDTMAGESLVL